MTHQNGRSSPIFLGVIPIFAVVRKPNISDKCLMNSRILHKGDDHKIRHWEKVWWNVAPETSHFPSCPDKATSAAPHKTSLDPWPTSSFFCEQVCMFDHLKTEVFYIQALCQISASFCIYYSLWNKTNYFLFLKTWKLKQNRTKTRPNQKKKKQTKQTKNSKIFNLLNWILHFEEKLYRHRESQNGCDSSRGICFFVNFLQ